MLEEAEKRLKQKDIVGDVAQRRLSGIERGSSHYSGMIIWSMEPLRLSIPLKAVYDMLPSPTNLFYWLRT
jgi:hypothetical protein